jgi:hypothetical protein
MRDNLDGRIATEVNTLPSTRSDFSTGGVFVAAGSEIG